MYVSMSAPNCRRTGVPPGVDRQAGPRTNGRLGGQLSYLIHQSSMLSVGPWTLELSRMPWILLLKTRNVGFCTIGSVGRLSAMFLSAAFTRAVRFCGLISASDALNRFVTFLLL